MRIVHSRKFSYGVALFCFYLLMCAGCSYTIEISVVGDNPFRPTFLLTKPTFVSPFGKEVPLRRFIVEMKSGKEQDRERLIWIFGVEPGHSIRVSEIEYGIIPVGFQEHKASEGLNAGNVYLAVAIGSGGAGGVEFTIIEEGGVFKVITSSPK